MEYNGFLEEGFHWDTAHNVICILSSPAWLWMCTHPNLGWPVAPARHVERQVRFSQFAVCNWKFSGGRLFPRLQQLSQRCEIWCLCVYANIYSCGGWQQLLLERSWVALVFVPLVSLASQGMSAAFWSFWKKKKTVNVFLGNRSALKHLKSCCCSRPSLISLCFVYVVVCSMIILSVFLPLSQTSWINEFLLLLVSQTWRGKLFTLDWHSQWCVLCH